MSLKAILLFITQVIINNTFAQQNNSTFINDGSVKYFYDSKLQVLNNMDSMNATYYRVINYRDGKIDGAVTDYYKSGSTMATGYYAGNKAIKGNENGNFTWYYENGKIFQSCNYINGLLDGVYLEYYPTGKKRFSVAYSLGRKYGCEFAWDENGKIIRRAFNENGVAYNRIECDTAFGNIKPKLEDNLKFKGAYDYEYPEGEFKFIGKNVYYKTNKFQAISIALVDVNDNVIASNQVKLGQHFYVRIFTSGLTARKSVYKYILAQSIDDTEGVNYGSSGNVNDEGNLDPLGVQLGGEIRVLPDKVNSKDFYFSFKIEDRLSDGILIGFVKFIVLR